MAQRQKPTALKPAARILFLPPLNRPSPFSPWLARLLPPPPPGKSIKLTPGSSKILSSAPLVSFPFHLETPQVRYCLIWPSGQGSTLTSPTSQPCTPAGLGTWRFSWSSPATPLLLARWLLPLYHPIFPKGHSPLLRSHASHMSCVMCAPWSPFNSLFLTCVEFFGMLPRIRRNLCAWFACCTRHSAQTARVMSLLWSLAAFFLSRRLILILYT
nr:VF1 [Norovirus GV]WDY38434.1 VF1 [Norovirus GV]WDY38442.1 VF1 [Norovirus GV]WDY38446.1 VF1 [Norovirus GV]WDY38450.1 VF1 [Norovirus GV]